MINPVINNPPKKTATGIILFSIIASYTNNAMQTRKANPPPSCLVKKEKNTYLEAEILVYNPTGLPLYIDSARYFVRSKGTVVASGSGDYDLLVN